MRRRRRTALPLAALGVVLAACTPQAPASTPSPAASVAEPEGAGTLRWALGADPTSLDPRRIVRDEDALVVDALFDSLTRLDEDLSPQPALATSWTSSSDATVFTFELDPEAVWHDGTPVTASDVVRGLERVADRTVEPPSLHGHLLRDVLGYEGAEVGRGLRGAVAESEHRLRLELRRPVPELPAVLAHPGLAPVPPAAVDDPELFGEAPVGNGPFALVEPWAHNQFLRLAPSATHPAPDNVDEIVFRIYLQDEDRELRHADLLTGQVQVSQLPPGRRGEVLAGPTVEGQVVDVRLVNDLTDTVSLLVFDTRRPPFDDERFRRAVSLLVDRAEVADRTEGAREPARGLVPPVLPGGRAGVCAWCRYDPDVAARLVDEVLADRAPDDPLPPIVLQTSTDEVHRTIAAQVAGELRTLGLEVEVAAVEAEDYLATAEEQRPAIVRLGWSPEEPTLRAWTEQLFGSSALGTSLSGWQPAPLRDLLDRASGSADPAVRTATWQEVEALALDAAVVAPLLLYRDDLLVAEGVEGLVRTPLGGVDLTELRVSGTSS